MTCPAMRRTLTTLGALALLFVVPIGPVPAQPDKPPPPPPANPLGPPTTPVVTTDIGPVTDDDNPDGLTTKTQNAEPLKEEEQVRTPQKRME